MGATALRDAVRHHTAKKILPQAHAASAVSEFLWSFVGTFCSVFACLPLAWFGVQALARASSGREDSSDEGLSPTLLPRVGRKLGQGKPERRESAPSFGKAFGIPTDRVKDASKS